MVPHTPDSQCCHAAGECFFFFFLTFCFVFDGSLSAAACRRDGLEGAGPPPAPPGAGASSRLATQCRVRRMRRAITVMMRSGRCRRRGSSRLSPSPPGAATAEAAPYWERSGTAPRGPPGLRGSGALARCSAGCGAETAWPGEHPGPWNGAEGLRPCRPALAAGAPSFSRGAPAADSLRSRRTPAARPTGAARCASGWLLLRVAARLLRSLLGDGVSRLLRARAVP